MVAVSLFGIGALFLLIIIVSIIMYFKTDDDIWFQMLWAITAFSVFIIFIPFAYQVTNISIGNPTDTEFISLENYNINNFDFGTQENVTNGTFYHMFQFESDTKFDDLIVSSEFCFYYNNSDEPNVLFIGTLDECFSSDSSPPIYILNNTNGLECSNIDFNDFFNGAYFGVICSDCNENNTILLERVNNTVGQEILINKSDIEIFDIETVDVHSYYIKNDLLGVRQANQWFYRFLWLVGFLILGFGFRGIVMVILIGNEVILDEK